MPTGIVARTISQARRSSALRTMNVRSRMLRATLWKNPRMMRTQSARKNHSSASAVAQCRATM